MCSSDLRRRRWLPGCLRSRPDNELRCIRGVKPCAGFGVIQGVLIMKTALSLSLALLALAPARAQVLRPEAVNGALLGGIAGAVIGNNSGSHNAGKGAAIGAATGLVLGEIVGSANADARPAAERRPMGPPGVVSVGVGYGHPGYGHGHGRGFRDRGHGYASFYYPGYSAGYYPYYDYPGVYSRSAAVDGLFWGGLAGAVMIRCETPLLAIDATS